MKTLFFLGQAPARPSSKHNVSGSYLHKWLHSIGYSDIAIAQNCHFYALIDIFPGSTKNGHQAPTTMQIAEYRPILQKALQDIQPDIIIPVGKMAISNVLNQKNIILADTVGKEVLVNPFSALPQPIACIPLSHPSGRSSWNHTHKNLIDRALENLKESAPPLDA